MGKSKGLVLIVALIVAILASGCGFVEVENSVAPAVSVATDTPQHFLPKANPLPVTIRSSVVMPEVKTTPVFEYPCPEAITVAPVDATTRMVLIVYPVGDGTIGVELRSMPCGENDSPCVSNRSVGVPGVELGDRIEVVELRCVSFDKKDGLCVEFATP